MTRPTNVTGGSTLLGATGTIPSSVTNISLGDVIDVDTTDRDDGDTLVWDETTGTYVFVPPASVAGLPWFKVTDYGAVGDDSTDDTTAILAAQSAAVAAGGGIVFFPKPPGGGYLCNGSLLDTSRSNAILRLPSLDALDDEQITIVWLGEIPPPPVVSVIGTTPVPNNHVVIRSTTNAGSGTPSLLGGWGPSGSFEDFTFLMFGCYNMTFRLPSNPVLTAMDLSHVTAIDLDQVVVDCGSYYVQGLTEPTTTTSYGIKTPKINNGAYTRLGAVNAIGFYTGIQAGEHTDGQQVAAWGCKVALETVAGYHAMHFDRFMAVHCERGIKATGGIAYLSIDQFNIEHAASGWWVTDYDVDDSSNYLKGRVEWKVTLAGVGHSSTWTVNGATNLLQNEMGTSTGGGTPSGAAGGDLSGTYPNPSVVDDSHSHTAATLPTSSSGTLLISDTPSTPLIFADLLQNEAQDDLLYSD